MNIKASPLGMELFHISGNTITINYKAVGSPLQFPARGIRIVSTVNDADFLILSFDGGATEGFVIPKGAEGANGDNTRTADYSFHNLGIELSKGAQIVVKGVPTILAVGDLYVTTFYEK